MVQTGQGRDFLLGIVSLLGDCDGKIHRYRVGNYELIYDQNKNLDNNLTSTTVIYEFGSCCVLCMDICRPLYFQIL